MILFVLCPPRTALPTGMLEGVLSAGVCAEARNKQGSLPLLTAGESVLTVLTANNAVPAAAAPAPQPSFDGIGTSTADGLLLLLSNMSDGTASSSSSVVFSSGSIMAPGWVLWVGVSLSVSFSHTQVSFGGFILCLD